MTAVLMILGRVISRQLNKWLEEAVTVLSENIKLWKKYVI